MRLVFAALAVLLSANVHAAYDKTWYHADFWSGEWPNGFSVPKSGVHVPARVTMDKELKPTIDCELPFKAVFNPWNEARRKLSQTRYITASKIVKMKAKRSFDFKEDGPDGKSAHITKGQVIEYLIYNGEGYFSIRIHGKEYTANQDLFKNFNKIPDTAFTEDQWLSLKCVGGQTAWLFAKDLYSTDKDGTNHYVDGLWNASIGDPGVDGYGEARDLTDDEIKKGGH